MQTRFSVTTGDADLTDIIQLVRLHALDVVQLCKETILFWRPELLKFGQGLASEVTAVHQEKDALCPGVFDEAVDEVAGGECLSAAAGHLDEGTGTILCEGTLPDSGWQ